MLQKRVNKNTNIRKSNGNLKRTNLLRIIFIIVALYFAVICIKFYVSILKTNMLPTKYVILATIIEIILVAFITIGLTKKHKTLKLNIICLLLAIVVSIGITIGNNYINATMKFLGSVFKPVSEFQEYYVIVGNDTRFSKLSDVEGYGMYSFQIEDEIKKKIEEKSSVTIVNAGSLVEIGNAMIDRSIRSALISSAQFDILSEEIDGFKDKVKIIDTEVSKIEQQESIEDANSKYKIGNGIFNLYISGIDVYGDINIVSRTDANLLATINTNTHEILLTSIPRDYYVTLHSKKAKDKLTHSGIYGISETVTTVEDLLGVDINYYLRINFSTLVNLVDILGGVDVYSDYTITSRGYAKLYHFEKGYNHLTGQEALVFSRERQAYKEGDNQRVINQQHVIEAIINKVSNNASILGMYSSILENLSGCFNTNIGSEDITKLVKAQIDTMPKWTITSNSLTGSSASRTTYSMGSQELYVTIPSQKSIDEARTKIQELMNKR